MIALPVPDNRILDTVICGDALSVLQGMESNSVDAIVTDPPAGISFMGKDWDNPNTFPLDARSGKRQDGGGSFGSGTRFNEMGKRERDAFIAFMREVMTEALRVLKPGGHALVWALPRTSHWTATALEDAGLEIRDCIYSIFGSGFPKSLNIGKVTGLPEHQGLGSALKPAVECWWLCRKPLSEHSIAANVLKWGVGAINVDGCRVGYTDGDIVTRRVNNVTIGGNGIYGGGKAAITGGHSQGRFPANLLLSHSLWCVPQGVKRVQANRWGKGNDRHNNNAIHPTSWSLPAIDTRGFEDQDGMEQVEAYDCAPDCPIAELDRQSGVRNGRNGTTRNISHFGNAVTGQSEAYPYRDEGTASRYFQQFHYFPKASRSERNQGCEGLPERDVRPLGISNWEGQTNGSGNTMGASKPQSNSHPTVKPLQLMRWLIRLITPPDGVVLDCFAGSGSTLVAAIQEGVHFIGIEQDESYTRIAEARIAHAWLEVW